MSRFLVGFAPLALAVDFEAHPHSHKKEHHKKKKADDTAITVDEQGEATDAFFMAKQYQDIIDEPEDLLEEDTSTLRPQHHLQIGAEHTANALDAKSMSPSSLIPNVFNKINVPGLHCSDGSEYYFLVVPAYRPGTTQIETEKIGVEFMGSGACVTGGTCKPQCGDVGSLMAQCSDISVSFLRMAVNRYVGKSPFKIAKKPVGFIPYDNAHPLANHTNVYISYCTSDSHLGDAVSSINGGWHFQGAKNARYVLDWTKHMFPETKELFVHGGSAGAIAIPQWSPTIAALFNKAQIRSHADSGLFYVPGTQGWHNFMAKMPWNFPNKHFEVPDHPLQTPRTMMSWYLDRAEQYKDRLTQAYIEAQYDFNEMDYNKRFLRAMKAETTNDALSEPNVAKAIFLNTMRQHAPRGSMYFRVNPGKIHYVTRGTWINKPELQPSQDSLVYRQWLDKYVNGKVSSLPVWDVNAEWMHNATSKVNMLQHASKAKKQYGANRKQKNGDQAETLFDFM